MKPPFASPSIRHVATSALLAAAVSACPSPPPPAAVGPTLTLNDAGTPEWLDEVAARCAKIASCAGAHDTPRLREPGACIDWWVARVRTRSDPVQTCLAAAKGCAEIAACARGAASDARAAEYCRAHPGAMTACDGNAFISCARDDVSASTRLECGAASARCEERKIAGGLVTRGCWSPALCPDGAPEERCDGQGGDKTSAILICHDGMVEGRTLCASGTRCVQHKEESGENGATCEPQGEHLHCAEVGARYCADDRLVECLAHGHYGDTRVSDCGALGLRCAGKGAGARCVITKPLECEPGPARCDGEDLAFCAAGRRVKVSCRGVGLGPCDADAQGPAAACARPK